MTEEGHPPRQPHQPGRSGASRYTRPSGRFRPHGPHDPRRTGWQAIDAFDDDSDTDAEPPPWAGPAGFAAPRVARRPPRTPVPEPRAAERDRRAGPGSQAPGPAAAAVSEEPWTEQDRPERGRRRPGRSRAAAARRRRYKRRLLTLGSAAILVVVVVGAVLFFTRSPAPKSQFVTTLQKGEYRTVPDACKIFSAAALRQVMNGTPVKIQPQQSPAQSECTYTVDAKPTFRVADINLQAMQANLAPVGNGSATADARYTLAERRSRLAKPPRHSLQPAASISAVPGLGDRAVSATQAFAAQSGTASNAAKAATDLVTVLVQYRNVLITVTFQGQTGNGFGPVSVAALRSGALTVARAALAGIKAEPTV